MRGGVVWDMSSTCVQGGLPRPLGGYQPNLIMEPHSPSPAWQLHHPIVPKQEPMEEDRNDSGINSGSDFHSSSPGSENSQDYNPSATYSSSQNTQNPQTSTYYSTPLISRIPTSSPMGYQTNTPLHLTYQHAISPSTRTLQVPQQDVNSNNFLEKRTPPPSSEQPQIENSENEDPLRRLQCSLERNGFISTPMLSPKASEHSEDNKSDEEEFDEQGLRVPRMNSHGKVKTFKCKQCDFVAITKLSFWEHTKSHIKADKLLTCPKCPFVTEYKHHLEYHLRNHFGSKPFKCDKCSYSCVNKSMLNSHMKSHSNIYQYRCADCTYATKYCHSLKLHLRKYSHKPAMVLNADGTPNPLPIIDVYGTRRGPKQRSSHKFEESDSPASTLQNQFTQLMLNANHPMQIPFPYHFLTGFAGPIANPLLFNPQNLENMANHIATSCEQTNEEESTHSHSDSPSPQCVEEQQTPQALDLSKPESSPAELQPPKNRRKGRAFKLENLHITNSSDEEDCQEPTREEEMKDATTPQKSPKPEVEEVTNNNNIKSNTNPNSECQYCNISFGDIVLYTMHMGYHGFRDPFTCNMCGEQCNDKVSFFLHIARNPHS